MMVCVLFFFGLVLAINSNLTFIVTVMCTFAAEIAGMTKVFSVVTFRELL
jgi:nitrogen fixation protein FixH